MNTPLVSVKWLFKNLSDPNLIILDGSLKLNKTGLQIIGARFFDIKTTFADTKNSLPNTICSPENFEREARNLGINNNSTIIVYDSIGIYSSPRVWWMFKIMGFQNIAVLDGGFPTWKKTGYPCEKQEQRTFKIGNFESNFNSKLIRNAEFIFNNIEVKTEVIIDARSEDRFHGEKPETRKGLVSGHIPNSKNLPFSKVLQDGKMKSNKELVKLFNTLNIPNKDLVFSCGSGVTACVLMLASELVLDNNKAIYDGSWSEWGQKGLFPVE